MKRREKSVEEIDQIMPCIFLSQHWPDLSDPATEEVLYDSPPLIWERESGLRSAGRDYHFDS
jgi:hypothetical protein